MQAQLSGEFMERLAIGCPDAVIYADAAGTIRFWNAAATRIFGFTAEEMLGQSLDPIIPERLRPRHWEGYREVMGGRESRYGEGDLLSVPAQRKDGTRLSIEFTILAMHDEAGAMTGIAAFLRDVTARFEEIRGLRRELAALQAARAAPGSGG